MPHSVGSAVPEVSLRLPCLVQRRGCIFFLLYVCVCSCVRGNREKFYFSSALKKCNWSTPAKSAHGASWLKTLHADILSNLTVSPLAIFRGSTFTAFPPLCFPHTTALCSLLPFITVTAVSTTRIEYCYSCTAYFVLYSLRIESCIQKYTHLTLLKERKESLLLSRVLFPLVDTFLNALHTLRQCHRRRRVQLLAA